MGNMKYHVIHMLYNLFHIVPVKKNRVVFSNMDNRRYGGDPRVVSEYLDHRIEKIWVIDKDVQTEFPKDVKRVSSHSVKKIFYYATARVWCDSHHVANRWKRKNQYLLQMWHGSFPLKKMEGQCAEYFSPQHMRDVVNCARMTDYQFSNSDKVTESLRLGLLYQGPVIKVGLPRNDCLVNLTDEEKTNVKKKLGLAVNKHYVLYAPTCRQHDCDDKTNQLDYKRIRKAFKKVYGEEWIILYRGHPISNMKNKEKLQDDQVIDVSDVQLETDLFMIADSIISDYSSVIGNCVTKKIPGFIFAYDYDSYNARRGFEYDMKEELPFPFAYTNDELERNILEFDKEKYMKELHALEKRWGYNETGKSTGVISNLIYKICDCDVVGKEK